MRRYASARHREKEETLPREVSTVVFASETNHGPIDARKQVKCSRAKRWA